MAEGILGRGDRAYEYYRDFLPAKYNDQAELHQVEPYVYSQFVHGPESRAPDMAAAVKSPARG